MRELIAYAKELGFFDAAILPVSGLVIVPEYRKFCEENLCGNFGRLPDCPPQSGTVEEMTARMGRYGSALVLNSVYTPVSMTDAAEHRARKRQHNVLTEQLMEHMREAGTEELLMMGAGPWKDASCMSAYSVDAQKMADRVGMKCWENDGKVRLFSLVLF